MTAIDHSFVSFLEFYEQLPSLAMTVDHTLGLDAQFVARQSELLFQRDVGWKVVQHNVFFGERFSEPSIVVCSNTTRSAVLPSGGQWRLLSSVGSGATIAGVLALSILLAGKSFPQQFGVRKIVPIDDQERMSWRLFLRDHSEVVLRLGKDSLLLEGVATYATQCTGLKADRHAMSSFEKYNSVSLIMTLTADMLPQCLGM